MTGDNNVTGNNMPSQVSEAVQRVRTSASAFEKFRRSFAEEYFGGFKKATASTLEGWYVAWHSLCICPGGRAGGQDHTLVEVFFGKRPHSATGPIHESASQQAFVTETGAELRYILLINGNVLVQLYPANTPSLGSNYDWILVDSLESASALLNKKILHRHWRYLVSCMATTSVVGAARWRDNWRMTWLQLWRETYAEGKLNPAPGPKLLIKAVSQFFAWFFGVALSGIAVYWIQSRKPDPVAPAVRVTAARVLVGNQVLHNDLKDLGKKLETIDTRLRPSDNAESRKSSESAKL